MFEAADEWDTAMSGHETIQNEKEKLLVIRSKDSAVAKGAIVIG